MRRVIDLILTINLVVLMGLGVYFWLSGQLVIEFTTSEPPIAMEATAIEVFRSTLYSEVNRTMGTPEKGYEPYMFLAAFPGLAASDFSGVEASTGSYQIENGTLTHKFAAGDLRHDAATAIAPRGIETLLTNVTNRINVDLAEGGTITEVMNAISTP